MIRNRYGVALLVGVILMIVIVVVWVVLNPPYTITSY
jgi:hypothetical protein